MERLEFKSIVALIAIVAIIFGAAGMLYSFPSLFSAKIENIIGAGFPFLSGAVLISGGLISIAITTRKNIGE
ncbi:MAG: hypothetical protein HC831_27090 [Chloroflexia bacterium]|nr:hypothetical protein [Chloroflexia bacterium]